MDEQQEADQEYEDYMAWEQAEAEHLDHMGREMAKEMEYHLREEWQKWRDWELSMMPPDVALDAYFEDERRRRDARHGLDEWPGL